MPTTYTNVPVKDFDDPPTVVKVATVTDDDGNHVFLGEFDQHTLDLIAAG